MARRYNHYVPEWYQKGFLIDHINSLYYLNLAPETKQLSDGRVITMNTTTIKPVSKTFAQTDLYTTFFGNYINDEIESVLFGKIDDTGARAIRAFIGEDVTQWHRQFTHFFSYIDSQKIRTPKGLDWIKAHYPELSQVELMVEMQAIRNMHCTIWTEGVREIVSAKNSPVKFILTDHPVTVYNYACPPDSQPCAYPNDPSIADIATQTIFPLDLDHCLILTNYQYAKDPFGQSPMHKRKNPRPVRTSLVRTDTFIRSRSLCEHEVERINLILKSRARRYIAAPKEEWLYPERNLRVKWSDLRMVLLPPDDLLWQYGGEIYVGYKDGTTYYQDAFGRVTPGIDFLYKKSKSSLGRNDLCGCGSGKKYKKCCINKKKDDRPSWEELSIRERNIALYNGVTDILGLNKGRTWDDVREDLCNEQVKKIHELYGFLWPVETNLFSLLPRFDNTLRALYTGVVDPRVIPAFALGLTPYFDEILIQHPFVHPSSIKPEYSPVHSPGKFKLQTLKNVWLLLVLMPFIEAGFINFIPDLCSLDMHLHRQMLKMSRGRSAGYRIEREEVKLLERLHEDDMKRSIQMLSMDQQERLVSRVMPELSAEKLKEVLKHLERAKMEDPFTPLQSELFEGDGQITMLSMVPNFEMSMFLAQVTGSCLLTDSPFRWREIKDSQSTQGGVVAYPWKEVTNFIEGLPFPVNALPDNAFFLRENRTFGTLKKAFNELNTAMRENKSPDVHLTTKFKKDFIEGLEIAKRSRYSQGVGSFTSRLHCLLPYGGIVHNNVHRMLLTSGSERHTSCVTMAIFVERTT